MPKASLGAIILLLCGATQPCSAASAAPSYTFTTFDYSKADNTIIQAINKSGTLVGTAISAAGVATCFTYNGKTKTQIALDCNNKDFRCMWMSGSRAGCRIRSVCEA